jgi:hypothetical protein
MLRLEIILLLIGYFYFFQNAFIISKTQYTLLPRLFASLSKSTDGFLTLDSFETFSSFVGISKTEAVNLFFQLDSSLDGKLSWDEIKAQDPFSKYLS